MVTGHSSLPLSTAPFFLLVHKGESFLIDRETKMGIAVGIDSVVKRYDAKLDQGALS
jgi:hypothetical protein